MFTDVAVRDGTRTVANEQTHTRHERAHAHTAAQDGRRACVAHVCRRAPACCRLAIHRPLDGVACLPRRPGRGVRRRHRRPERQPACTHRRRRPAIGTEVA